MKEIFLSQLCGYWYFFEGELVQAAVAVADRATPVKKAGRVLLPLEDGENAEICPLNLLFPWAAQQSTKHDHYLLIRHGERLLALPMWGAGRLCMAAMDEVRPLPPAFTGLSRQVIPAVLANGNEVFMQVNLNELVEMMDKIAYLRKKKLLQNRLTLGQKEAQHAN